MAFPSLESLALVQTASEVFNDSITYLGLRKLIPRERRYALYPLEGWSMLHVEVSKRLDDIFLPHKTLKCQVWHIVRKFYISVCRYYSDIWLHSSNTDEYDKFLAMGCGVQRLFSFTSLGEVHRSKLLESFVEKCVAEDVTCFNFRFWYTVACELCLDDCVMKMWEIMSEEDHLWVREQSFTNPLLAFWFNMMGEENNTTDVLRLHYHLYDPDSSIFANFFNYAVNCGHEGALEYFWSKLTENERVKCAPQCAEFACEDQITSLLFSTLTYLKKEQQLQLFEEEGILVLYCILEWPYHEYLFPALERSWNCFDICDYLILFEVIVEEIMIQPGVNNPFLNILKKVWTKIPCHIKQDILDVIGTSDKFMHGIFTLFLALLKEVFDE